GEEAEGDHHAGGDDGGGEEPDDEVTAGEAEAVEGPGQGGANGEGEHGGQACLDGGHPEQMGDVDARGAAAVGCCSEDSPKHQGDQHGDGGGERDGGGDA